jgi:hypothetical protein
MRALRREWGEGQGWVLEGTGCPTGRYPPRHTLRVAPAEPPTARVPLARRAKPRRKRERAPRLMARKPRRTEVRRPALEGPNKQTAPTPCPFCRHPGAARGLAFICRSCADYPTCRASGSLRQSFFRQHATGRYGRLPFLRWQISRCRPGKRRLAAPKLPASCCR